MELLDRYEALKQKVVDRKESFNRFLNLLEGEITWLTSYTIRETKLIIGMVYFEVVD
jgi:hypothetical protein